MSDPLKRIVFEATDIRFRVKDRHKPSGYKEILHGVSVSGHSGEVIGILGPSGAGKTCFLKIITATMYTGEATGSVTVNGETLTQQRLKEYCFVVDQNDFMWPYLTCKENIAYATQFYQQEHGELEDDENKVGESTDEIVARILKTLGLEVCEDTLVGGKKGLSGGQKRRLSVAVGLVKNPQIMFLDEPTSGLDSAAARELMKHLHQVTTEHKVLVIITIHQPSTKIFMKLDRVMFLSKGEEAYFGKPTHLVEYLHKHGKTNIGMRNPADYYLDEINDDFVREPSVYEETMNSWRNEDIKRLDSPETQGKLETIGKTVQASFMSQIKILFHRHITITRRDPTPWAGRGMAIFFLFTLFNTAYLKVRSREQKHIQAHVFLLSWILGFGAIFTAVMVFANYVEFKQVNLEVRNGMYSGKAYLIVKNIIIIPGMFFLALLGAIPCYTIGYFKFSGVFWWILQSAGVFWAFEGMAYFFSITQEDPLLGSAQFVNLWSMQFVFMCALQRCPSYIWPLRTFSYSSILRWAFELGINLEFEDTDYGECTGGPPHCWGNNGYEIIESINGLFGPFDHSDRVKRKDLIYIYIIGTVYIVAYAMLFLVKLNQKVTFKNQEEKYDGKTSRMYIQKSNS